MIRAHVLATLSKLRDGGVTAYDTDEVPDLPETPYVVVYADSGPETGRRLNARSSTRTWRVATKHVGSTADEARWAAEYVETALLDQRITVTGWSCSPCWRESSKDVTEDPDGGVLYVGVDVWRFASTRRSAA